MGRVFTPGAPPAVMARFLKACVCSLFMVLPEKALTPLPDFVHRHEVCGGTLIRTGCTLGLPSSPKASRTAEP